ncbi:hypothetical protein [Brevundimonas sp.]|uniref:hypothetical protein n=1 Tax=Brevundimonas sp. TaxID=1871086 RepID=UPI002CA3EFAB|nr:hypothetical protein [Brevundimonas sp.]HWQ87847.1 hypothetical protein [Brevundimonas sp.]
MTRTLFVSAVATGVISIAACNQAGPEAPAAPAAPATAITPTKAGHIPGAVRAAVLTARPGMIIAEAELKEREGRRYYDVEGRMPDGSEIELDLLETPAGWKVVEIQRDLPWTAVPAGVRAAAEGARAGFIPVRVIESTQAEDGAVIYELFADGQPATPALEVRVHDGRAEVLKEVWPH